ncbi:MAG: TetR/AcrR family transcriptional regulator [Stackebrandtia sp.]
MTTEDDVPAQLRRLWGLSAPTRRGRPAELDGRRVVRAAIELADRDGLSGVTLARLAEHLGYSPMSLYRYMGSMDELQVLMVDAISDDVESLQPLPAGWRAGLRRWAGGVLEQAHKHPWMHHIPMTGPPSGPGSMAWLDAGLSILRDTGLDWPQKLGIITLISGYVRTYALQTEGMRRGREGSGLDQPQAEAQWARHLARLIDPERFPEVAALMASDTFAATPQPPDDPTADPDFLYGLERILDGVAVSVEAAV